MTLALRAATRTDVGLRREHNEDAAFIGHRLFALADGMGGQAYGEVASRIAILTAARLDSDSGADLLTELRDVIGDANEQLRTMIAGNEDYDGMGTTFVALLVAGGRIALAHIGDSRAYLFRDGELSQITHDHSFVQGLVDAGQISEAEALTHPSRAVITKALDGHGDVEADLGLLEGRIGDRYLLCSDGLSDYVSADTIAESLQLPERSETCDRLVELALRAGGPDNVTVIVVDIVDEAGDLESAEVVIVGAADDGGEPSTDAPPDTAAGRAAGLGPRRVLSERGIRIPRGPGRRVALVLVSAFVVAVLALLGIFVYSRSQFYVGTTGSPATVAVYRGVPGGVLGIDLSRLQTATDIPISELPEDDRDRVEGDITASNQSDVNSIVATLRSDGCQVASKPVKVIEPKREPDTGNSPQPSSSPTVTPTPGSPSKLARHHNKTKSKSKTSTHLQVIRPSWCTS